MSGFSCPLPVDASVECITLAHGEGGRSRRLIQEHIVPRFHSTCLDALGDAAIIPRITGPIAFSTDSFVVSPLFFPGGSIGTLAVCGTVNDLAVAGARPLWLSLSLILEEGLAMAALLRVLDEIAHAACEAEVAIVCGDTKVVPRGAADQMFITTAGIGALRDPVPPGPTAIEPGDRLIVTGPIGRHGVAVLCAREQIDFQPPPSSDCAPLSRVVAGLFESGIVCRALRDATRGGVAAVLHEWAHVNRHTMVIEESSLPVSPEVRGVCELLGLDPLHMANEGTMVIAVPCDHADRALDVLRDFDVSRHAKIIGEVRPPSVAPVVVRRTFRELPLDEPQGMPLPRIC